MGKLFTAAQRAARIGSAVAFLWVTLAGAGAGAAPPESVGLPPYEVLDPGTGSSSELPMLPAARPPALQLLLFDPAHALSLAATDALGAEVRTIFRGLGVEVAFRVATPDATYGDSPVLEIPIIILRDDPIVARRPRHVMGLVVRHQEPNRAVWAFLSNVSWTLGHDRERGLPAAAHEPALGLALGRVVGHEVIHALAPDEPHSTSGLMSHSMNRDFLLGDRAPLETRCGRAFLAGLAARAPRVPAEGPAAALASVR